MSDELYWTPERRDRAICNTNGCTGRFEIEIMSGKCLFCRSKRLRKDKERRMGGRK